MQKSRLATPADNAALPPNNFVGGLAVSRFANWIVVVCLAYRQVVCIALVY